MCGTTPNSVCKTPCSGIFATTLPIDNTTPISAREIPCALRRTVRDGISREILEHGCESNFFDWVENHRARYPEIEEDELRMCPLLWCRMTFDSKESTISHVFDCPRLSNAWYWCPSHKRPERFLECNQLCEGVPKARSRNKDYKLHLGDKFLNWIRRRRSEKRLTEFNERTSLDEDMRLGFKSELGTGPDQILELPGSGLVSYRANESPTRPRWIRENVECQGDRSVIAGKDGEGPYFPASQEMYDPSFPLEMPTWTPSQRQDSPALLHPINSEPGRRSLWHKLHKTPAIDPRYSTAKQSTYGWPNTHESSNMISSITRDASWTDDRAPIIANRPKSTPNPILHNHRDGNERAILVETELSRESSDSSRPSTESPRVETTISSSPRRKLFDWNRSSPTPSQRMSLNLTRPMPLVPSSDDILMSSTPPGASSRRSVLDRAHRLSGRKSVHIFDSGTVGSALTDKSSYMNDVTYDNGCDLSSLDTPSTENEFMNDEELAVTASCANPASLGELKNPSPPWNAISPSTLAPASASLDSNFVSPTSTNSAPSSPFPNSSSPISPIAEYAATNVDFPSSPYSGLSSPVLNTLSSISPIANSGYQPSNIPLAYGAQWNEDNIPNEELAAPFTYIQPHLLSMRSSDLTSSVQSGSIEGSSEPKAPSSMVELLMTQLDTFITSSSVFPPSASSSSSSAQVIEKDSRSMDRSMEMATTDMPAPLFAPIDMKVNDHGLNKLPSPVGSSDLSSFSSAYSSQLQSGVALWSRRQAHVPPLTLSRSNVSSSGDQRERSRLNPWGSRVTPRFPRMLPQSWSGEGQRSGDKVAGSESDPAAAYQGRQYLPIAIDTPFSQKPLPHCYYHESMLVTRSSSKQTLVARLGEWFSVVREDWMQKLQSNTELWLRCSVPSPHDLFGKALSMLREFVHGRSAQTLENVFVFVQLTFAIALTLHSQQNFSCLETFYYDALQLQHTISDKEDKKLFLRVMNHWWGFPEPHLTDLPDINRDTSSVSMIVSVCIDFFDSFEEAEICERNAQYSAESQALLAQVRTRDGEHMIHHITGPLQQERGIEALGRIVTDTEWLIDRGLLQTTREVEVTLKSNGRRSSESPEVLERYHNTVSGLCDQAMASSSLAWYPSWRNEHYSADIDRILGMLNGQNGIGPDHPDLSFSPNIVRSEVSYPNLTFLDSPTPWSSVSNAFVTLDSSSTGVMSWTPTHSSERTELSNQTTSLTTTPSQHSGSPTSPIPDTPSTSVVSCPQCSIDFTGSPQDARSNYQRHLRETRRHNKEAGLKCPLPDCDTKPPMRSDNLAPHLRKQHGMSQIQAQATATECKVSARRAKSHTAPRRRSRRKQKATSTSSSSVPESADTVAIPLSDFF